VTFFFFLVEVLHGAVSSLVSSMVSSPSSEGSSPTMGKFGTPQPYRRVATMSAATAITVMAANPTPMPRGFVAAAGAGPATGLVPKLMEADGSVTGEGAGACVTAAAEVDVEGVDGNAEMVYGAAVVAALLLGGGVLWLAGVVGCATTGLLPATVGKGLAVAWLGLVVAPTAAAAISAALPA